jgi:hypothetical protein
MGTVLFVTAVSTRNVKKDNTENKTITLKSRTTIDFILDQLEKVWFA